MKGYIINPDKEYAQKIIDGAENQSQIIMQTANTEATRIIEDARKRGEKEYEILEVKFKE